jgi:DNA invertase Pin-like site-specific DNA recombinase
VIRQRDPLVAEGLRGIGHFPWRAAAVRPVRVAISHPFGLLRLARSRYDPRVARVLGGVRLSRLTDETTSPERQREQITTWSKLHGHSVADMTEDTDVSGAMPATARPGLGPWLTDPALSREWDVLVVSKLDRCTRSVSDLCSLIDYCEANGKTLVSIAESFDLGTPAGRMVATILASVAAFERERIAERRREAAVFLRKHARYGGGVVPFGYRPEQIPGGGWTLVPDGEEAEVIRWAAGQVIAGRSVTALSEQLTRRGVMTSRGRSGGATHRWARSCAARSCSARFLTTAPWCATTTAWSSAGSRSSPTRPGRGSRQHCPGTASHVAVRGLVR